MFFKGDVWFFGIIGYLYYDYWDFFVYIWIEEDFDF